MIYSPALRTNGGVSQALEAFQATTTERSSDLTSSNRSAILTLVVIAVVSRNTIAADTTISSGFGYLYYANRAGREARDVARCPPRNVRRTPGFLFARKVALRSGLRHIAPSQLNRDDEHT